MADVFISYSHEDRDQVLRLAALLKSKGYTVWWDKSLDAGDRYRDEIVSQLVSARAVIVVWTPSSIRSDWVRAEAGFAKARGKLIPVKSGGVSYDMIPLPFGELHTQELSQSDTIVAAVTAHLIEPAVEPSLLLYFSGAVQYQALVWFGIVGGTITLFSHLDGLFTLANWAQALVWHWSAWSEMVWNAVFDAFAMRVPREAVPFLSFMIFALSVAVGAGRNFRLFRANQPVPDLVAPLGGQRLQMRRSLQIAALVIIALAVATALVVFVDQVLIARGYISKATRIDIWLLMAFALPTIILSLLFRGPGRVLGFMIVLTICFAIILHPRFDDIFRLVLHYTNDARMSLLQFFLTQRAIDFSVGMMIGEAVMGACTLVVLAMGLLPLYVLPFFMLRLASFEALMRRFLFLALGIAILIALSELSKAEPMVRKLLSPPT